MKIKTLIVLDNLRTGGVATSLYNFLHSTKDILDCDLLVFNEESIDEDKVPSSVKILQPQTLLHILGKFHNEIKEESSWMTLFRIVLFVFARYINGEFSRCLLFPFIRCLGNYDFAISYAQDDSWKSLSKGCNDYVIKKVKAKYKVAMVHCDYANFGGYDKRQTALFEKFDTIICVSESCCKSFVSCFPNLKEKVIACENFINVDEIRHLSEDSIEYSHDNINFVSVCRLSYVKGLSRTINVFKRLFDEGIINFRWTIVGDGLEYDNLVKQSRSCGLSEQILFVGNQLPPYPYIKNASYFLLPSLHEAAPMVFGECAVLGVPIISTRTCSAVELVEDRSLGIVTENCAEGIYSVLKNILTGIPFYYIKPDIDTINSNAYRQFNHLINLVKDKIRC